MTNIYYTMTFSFAKQYNETIETEVKRRKMWLVANESWLAITDNEVNDLPGFEKKLEEQKVLDIFKKIGI